MHSIHTLWIPNEIISESKISSIMAADNTGKKLYQSDKLG